MREQIVSDIRRLAEENLGNPPEKQAFERHTGIREHRWRGVYWTNWGRSPEGGWVRA